jgi:hypothetical protein
MTPRAGMIVRHLHERFSISCEALECLGSIMHGLMDPFKIGDCAVTYKRGRRILAVARISRDLQSLEAEHDLKLT